MIISDIFGVYEWDGFCVMLIREVWFILVPYDGSGFYCCVHLCQCGGVSVYLFELFSVYAVEWSLVKFDVELCIGGIFCEYEK